MAGAALAALPSRAISTIGRAYRPSVTAQIAASMEEVERARIAGTDNPFPMLLAAAAAHPIPDVDDETEGAILAAVRDAIAAGARTMADVVSAAFRAIKDQYRTATAEQFQAIRAWARAGLFDVGVIA